MNGVQCYELFGRIALKNHVFFPGARGVDNLGVNAIYQVLWMCGSQLCGIFCTIFNLSFMCGVVSDIWKSCCIVPVPKNNKVGSMNDLTPVALTNVAFKTCERIVPPQLKSFIHDSLDPFQFAYQSNRNCEEALLVTINEVTSHLHFKLSVKKNKVGGIITKSRNSARLFFRPSAFNTIQPHFLPNKMLYMSVPNDMLLWIIDYLASGSQLVIFQSLKSDTLYSNTGVPQGTVLASFFSVCTRPIAVHPTNHVLLLNLPMTQF